MMRTMIFAAMIGLIPAHGLADPFDGNHLHEICQAPINSGNKGLAIGYIAGMTDNMKIAGNKAVSYCVPNNVTYGQIVDVVCGFLARHPEARHLAGLELIPRAVSEAWPCSR